MAGCDSAPSNNAESIDVTQFAQTYLDTKAVSKANLHSTTFEKLPESMQNEIKKTSSDYKSNTPVLTADYTTAFTSGTMILLPGKDKSIAGYIIDSVLPTTVKPDLFKYDDSKINSRRLEHKPQMGPIKANPLENKLSESTIPLPPIPNVPDSEFQDNPPKPEVKTNVVYVSNTKGYIGAFLAGLAIGALGIYVVMRKRE